MLCPYCGEGPVYHARFLPNGETIRICAECDTVWRKMGSIVEVTNYGAYTKLLELPPLWDQLELLSAVEDRKENS